MMVANDKTVAFHDEPVQRNLQTKAIKQERPAIRIQFNRCMKLGLDLTLLSQIRDLEIAKLQFIVGCVRGFIA
jgi:hypothetical protein